MKNVYRLTSLIGVVLLFVLLGCATSQNHTTFRSDDSSGGSSEVEVTNPSITLTDYLRRVPGVQVSGDGPNASITIRGTQSIMLSSTPLFVIDGVRVGRNLSQVHGLVSMSQVTKIKVLKGIEASAGYGMDGSNGVIEIFMQ